MSAIDDVAAWWDARPCNVRHSSAPLGSRRYFDEVEARKYRVEPHIPRFADFPRWAGHDVLEIGSGLGTEIVNFARAGARVVAVDVSPASAALARLRLARYDLPGRVLTADAAALDYDSAFDLVWAFGSIHHSPDPPAVAAAAARALRPGGELRMMLYHRWSTKAFAVSHGRPWRNDLVAARSEAASGCPFTFTFSRRSARALAAGAGLDPVSARVDHIFPYRVADYAAHRYRRRLPWSALPAPAFRAVERAVGWHLLVVATKPG